MKKILESKEELNLGEISLVEKREEDFDKQWFEESSKDEDWVKQIQETIKKTISEKSHQPSAEKEDKLKKEEDMTKQLCRVISDFDAN